MILLIDHNIEGQAKRIWETIREAGWLEWIEIQFMTFEELQLPIDSSDRVVWQFAQDRKMMILTANRRMRGKDSLEETIRAENTVSSLPVITIGNVDKIKERTYRERCAVGLIEVALNPANVMGVGRIYIP
jgi:Fe-S cluster biosynthesis and repair protein YggX